MTPEEMKATVEELLPGIAVRAEGLPAAPGAAQAGGYLVVEPRDLTTVCRRLKDSERFALDYLANVTAIDYPPPTGTPSDAGEAKEGRIELVYHLYATTKAHGQVALKVAVPRATPVVDSVTPIWRGAEFQEREVYDLFGVQFTGHPDLRRILMWDEFVGHPMRKDYVPEDQDAVS